MYRGVLIAPLICLFATTQSFAHSGRTDSRGGHCVGGAASDGSCPSGDYHFHNGGEDDAGDVLVIIGGSIIAILLGWWLLSSLSMMGGDFAGTDESINGLLEPTYDIETNAIGVKYNLDF